jgi:hypothetical protein
MTSLPVNPIDNFNANWKRFPEVAEIRKKTADAYRSLRKTDPKKARDISKADRIKA